MIFKARDFEVGLKIEFVIIKYYFEEVVYKVILVVDKFKIFYYSNRRVKDRFFGFFSVSICLWCGRVLYVNRRDCFVFNDICYGCGKRGYWK